MKYPSLSLATVTLFWGLQQPMLLAASAAPTETVACDILVAGGGLSGTATAYEALLAGQTVCLTEITDWIGGQVSAQGTSALDERPTQRKKLFFPRGYKEFRQGIKDYYGKLNPGDCWVSESCFMPVAGHQILTKMLAEAAAKGNGKLKWFPNTVIKDLKLVTKGQGQQIGNAIAIQHSPQPGAAPLNTKPLSQTITDAYTYADSAQFRKKVIKFAPARRNLKAADWYVVEATETGELIGLADVPYRLGLDPQSYSEPSSASKVGDTYCTQGFTYPFAMETTDLPQTQVAPRNYKQYEPYYSYEKQNLADFGLVHSYRRISGTGKGQKTKFGNFAFTAPATGDISMQNWTWGNDYRPGGAQENLILDKAQLQASNQLQPDGWLGGLRPETLQKGEEIAQGFYYWLATGVSDRNAQTNPLAPGSWRKITHLNHRYLQGLESPMGTAHGLSKYPYIREGRRIVGRPSYGYKAGFTVDEVDISRNDLWKPERLAKLSDSEKRLLAATLAGFEGLDRITDPNVPTKLKQRQRATVYPDAVGIGHYAIDFHPCMQNSPPEAPKNQERKGARNGEGQAYPFQIPLRSMIPQKIDNMLVAGKSIATSHVAAAAYRVHSFEWSAGAAAGTTAAFALEKGMMPYEMVQNLPKPTPELQELRKRLEFQDNPTMFPGTSIFNNNWKEWK